MTKGEVIKKAFGEEKTPIQISEMEDWEEHNVVGSFAERPLPEDFHFSLPMSLRYCLEWG
jgi:hypothetical protein